MFPVARKAPDGRFSSERIGGLYLELLGHGFRGLDQREACGGRGQERLGPDLHIQQIIDAHVALDGDAEDVDQLSGTFAANDYSAQDDAGLLETISLTVSLCASGILPGWRSTPVEGR